MTQINVGSAANDNTGDPLRTAFLRINQYGLLNDKTVDAAFYKTASITNEAAITLAIVAAKLLGTGAAVRVPASMLPYTASLVTFDTAVRMIREGGDPTAYDVLAYGAAGDGATDDSQAFISALAGAGGNIEYFGTTMIACPPVVVPTLASPSGQTKSYKITQTLALPSGCRMRGLGPFGAVLQFVPVGNNSTLLTYFGSAEAQQANLLLENLYFFQNGTVSTSIGFRSRNASFIQLRNCVFSNFRVGVWLDWGQDIDCYDTQFSLCERGVQLGGNLTQTETPAPPAGVRAAPQQTNHWMDNASFMFCKFSQNKVDVNHLGCLVSHGCTTFLNCTFFESSPSPVTGKTRFIHTTNLKGLSLIDSWFEAGADGRTGVVQSAFDFDGNAGGQNLGGVIQGNHFLLTGFTGGASSVIGVDIESGAAVISGNTIEINAFATATHIKLNDGTRSSSVLQNTYLNYPDTLVAARYVLTGKHQILEAAGAKLGQVVIDDASFAQLEFQIGEVRKAGINVFASDTMRFYDSGGTVKLQLRMGAVSGFGQFMPLVGVAVTPTEAVLVSGVDASGGNAFITTLTAARVVGAPINPTSGQRIVYTFIQSGAGAFAVTWNAVFKVTWADTGNATPKRSSIAFVFDGTAWNQDGAQAPYV